MHRTISSDTEAYAKGRQVWSDHFILCGIRFSITFHAKKDDVVEG
jgi:hypothetical protein